MGKMKGNRPALPNNGSQVRGQTPLSFMKTKGTGSKSTTAAVPFTVNQIPANVSKPKAGK